MMEKMEHQEQLPKRRWRPPKLRTAEELAAILKAKEEKERRKKEREAKNENKILDNYDNHEEEEFEPSDWNALRFSDFAQFIDSAYVTSLKEVKEDKNGKYIELLGTKFYERNAEKNSKHVYRFSGSSIFVGDQIPWTRIWKWVSYRYTRDWNRRELQCHDAQLNWEWVQVLKKLRDTQKLWRDENEMFWLFKKMEV